MRETYTHRLMLMLRFYFSFFYNDDFFVIFERIDDALLSDSQQQQNFQNLKNDVTHTKSKQITHVRDDAHPCVCGGCYREIVRLDITNIFILSSSPKHSSFFNFERLRRDVMTRREVFTYEIKTFHTEKDSRNSKKMPITLIFSLSQDKSSLTIK